MKALILSFVIVSSTSAFADSLRLEQDITLERTGSTMLLFSTQAPGALGSICNLHAYVTSTSSDRTLVLKQGSEHKVVSIKSKEVFIDSDWDGKKYEVSTVTADLGVFNSYLVVTCRALKGSQRVPSSAELLQIFSPYVSLTR